MRIRDSFALAVLVVLVGASSAQTKRGALFIAGGDFRHDNAGWDRFIELAGGRGQLKKERDSEGLVWFLSSRAQFRRWTSGWPPAASP